MDSSCGSRISISGPLCEFLALRPDIDVVWPLLESAERVRGTSFFFNVASPNVPCYRLQWFSAENQTKAS